jgi:pSer/pThr/pTyr-binding forkhead associated (FHA) protein
MGVTLVMFTQGGERRDFPVSGAKAIIGRNGDCDIQVALGVVSRHHCELTVKKDVALRDMGSSNGTYVNNKRVQEAQLRAGDTVMVGPVVFTVVIDGKPEEIKPVRTVLEASKRKKRAAKPDAAAKGGGSAAPAAKKLDDTGSIDLDEMGDLDLAEDDAGGSDSGSLAALEEISKQHKSKP